MISPMELEDRRRIYQISYDTLLNMHRKTPTVLEVCLYMVVTMKEEPEKILQILIEEKTNAETIINS